ncbi:MAG: anti-sigma factor family protein [Candidatus Binatia bacterium]
MKRLVAVMMRLVGKRTCEDVIAVLQEYFDGTLEPKLAAIIERHFRNCPDCAAFASSYEGVIKLTSELPCDEIPHEVQERVRQALRARFTRAQ